MEKMEMERREWGGKEKENREEEEKDKLDN